MQYIAFGKLQRLNKGDVEESMDGADGCMGANIRLAEMNDGSNLSLDYGHFALSWPDVRKAY